MLVGRLCIRLWEQIYQNRKYANVSRNNLYYGVYDCLTFSYDQLSNEEHAGVSRSRRREMVGRSVGKFASLYDHFVFLFWHFRFCTGSTYDTLIATYSDDRQRQTNKRNKITRPMPTAWPAINYSPLCTHSVLGRSVVTSMSDRVADLLCLLSLTYLLTDVAVKRFFDPITIVGHARLAIHRAVEEIGRGVLRCCLSVSRAALAPYYSPIPPLSDTACDGAKLIAEV